LKSQHNGGWTELVSYKHKMLVIGPERLLNESVLCKRPI